MTPNQPDNTDDEEVNPRQQRQTNNATGDMMVGASHALLGLLSGNYNRAAMEYGKGNQYLQQQRAQDVAQQQNLTTTIDQQTGKPVLTPKIEAAGQQPYIKPVQHGYAPQYLKNKITGETAVGTWTPQGMIVNGKQADENWFRFEPEQSLRLPTAAGGVGFQFRDKVTGKMTPGPSRSGVGDYETDAQGNPVPKEVARSNIASGAASAKKAADINDSKASLQEQLRIISDPNSSGANFAAALEGAQKSMISQKLSGAESDRMKGAQFTSYLQELADFGDRKITGSPSDAKRKQYIDMVNSGINELNARASSRQAVASNVKGLNTGTQASKSAQAELTQSQSAAKKMWPNDPDKQQRFIQAEKARLGM